jgi:hypothetical protein
MEKNTLFEVLCHLKEQGYDYLNSNQCECYTGYDQAVADFYEGCGDHEPSYLDWLKDTVAQSCEIDNYVFYNSGSIFYGNISNSEINSDVTFVDFTSDTEIENRIGSIEELIDGEIDHTGIFAIAIWNFGLEKETDRIKNLSDYTKGFQSKDFGFCIDYSELYSLMFVDSACWSDTEFVLGVSKLISGYNTETLKYFCGAINPSLKTTEFVTEIIKINPNMASFLTV